MWAALTVRQYGIQHSACNLSEEQYENFYSLDTIRSPVVRS